jgi:hypothetical protein
MINAPHNEQDIARRCSFNVGNVMVSASTVYCKGVSMISKNIHRMHKSVPYDKDEF